MIVLGFDMDGVLVRGPFRPYIFPWIVKYFKENKVPLSEEEILREIIKEHRDRLNVSQKFVYPFDWDDIVKKIAKKYNIKFRESISTWVEKAVQNEDAVYVYPDVIETLEKLSKRKDLTMLLITNGYIAYQAPVLKSRGLDKYFKHIYTNDIIGYGKPIKEYIEKTLMKEKGDRYLYVGDWLYFDMVASKKAGAEFIWIYRFEVPDTLKSLAPWERVKHSDFPRFYEKAWEKEIMRLKNIFEFIPDYMVTTLEEIEDILEYKK